MKTAFFILFLSLTSLAHSLEINSEKIAVNPAKIIKQVLLVNDEETYQRIQLIHEFVMGSTDLSNTGRIIFSISQLADDRDASASFIISETISLQSAKELSYGVYEITYMDASIDSNNLTVTKIIDARKALKSILNSCGFFESCEVKTAIELK